MSVWRTADRLPEQWAMQRTVFSVTADVALLTATGSQPAFCRTTQNVNRPSRPVKSILVCPMNLNATHRYALHGPSCSASRRIRLAVCCTSTTRLGHPLTSSTTQRNACSTHQAIRAPIGSPSVSAYLRSALISLSIVDLAFTSSLHTQQRLSFLLSLLTWSSYLLPSWLRPRALRVFARPQLSPIIRVVIKRVDRKTAMVITRIANRLNHERL